MLVVRDRVVVAYTAMNAELCDPIYQDFLQETNIAVRPKYGPDVGRTGGLAEAILAERDRPRCNVFWNNEPLGTLRLERKGLLEAYRPPMADNFPAMDHSPKGFLAWLRPRPGADRQQQRRFRKREAAVDSRPG